MARFGDHQKALALRKQEMSYSQIKDILRVSKSTLSFWLKNYPLSRERINELRGRSERRIEKFRETMRQKKEERLQGFYKEQKKIIFPLSKKELYLAGLFLYLGEGSRSKEAMLSVSNTDPSVIKFFMTWLTKNLNIPKNKLKIHLHLYKDMDILREIKFWSNFLNIPTSQFNKPYIKKTTTKNINHKGGFGHGTCNISVGNARLTERILMGLKTISDYYKNL